MTALSGDVYDVKAEVEWSVSNLTARRVGYFLYTFEGEHDGVAIVAGKPARELVLAVRDDEGQVYVVHQGVMAGPSLDLLWQKSSESKRFGVSVTLASSGRVIVRVRYELIASETKFGLVSI